MFYLLLPTAIWCGTFLASMSIEDYHQDDRSFGPCIIFLLAPVALICVIKAVKDCVTLEGGDAALMQGFLWNLPVVAVIAAPFLLSGRK